MATEEEKRELFASTVIALTLAMLLILVAVFFGCAEAAAADAGDYPYCSVCRIENSLGRDAVRGSGSLVGVSSDRAIVLSCAHLFLDDNDRREVGKVSCTFPGGRRFAARLLAVDANNDLASMEINRPSGLAPLRLAPIKETTGPFRTLGYPAQGGFRYLDGGNLLGVNQKGEATISGRCYDGFSGGPLVDCNGTQVGVTIRTGPSGRPTYTIAICGPVIRFLDRWLEAQR